MQAITFLTSYIVIIQLTAMQCVGIRSSIRLQCTRCKMIYLCTNAQDSVLGVMLRNNINRRITISL